MIFNNIILKDNDKIYNEFKLMTNLFYILMKFIIRNKLFVTKLIIESNRNFFHKHNLCYVLIIVQIIIILFFIYILFNFDKNNIVNNFLKRFVIRFIVIILFIFEINKE